MFNFQDWSKEFFQRATEPMSKQLSEIFLRMCLLEKQDSLNLEEVKQEFLYQMITKRAKYMGLVMSEPAKIFLMILAVSPGNAVMYLSAIRSQTTSIDMTGLAQMFPAGFLSEKDAEKMWDKQKGHVNDELSDNCLDRLEFN